MPTQNQLATSNAVKRSTSLPKNLYKKDLAEDPRLLMVAKYLARGEAPEDACSKSGFRFDNIHDAMRFCVLPEIVALAQAYKEGVHAVVQGYTPLALQRNLELMMGLHEASPAVQQRAADSILDRGGVPKVSQQIVDRRGEVGDSLGALLGGSDEVAILVKRGAKRAKKRLSDEKEPGLIAEPANA